MMIICKRNYDLNSGKGDDLQLNYYSQSCPNAEEIIKQEVTTLYDKHGNTAVSWIRNLFHDCMVKV
jgi:peroxidase